MGMRNSNRQRIRRIVLAGGKRRAAGRQQHAHHLPDLILSAVPVPTMAFFTSRVAYSATGNPPADSVTINAPRA